MPLFQATKICGMLDELLTITNENIRRNDSVDCHRFPFRMTMWNNQGNQKADCIADMCEEWRVKSEEVWERCEGINPTPDSTVEVQNL